MRIGLEVHVALPTKSKLFCSCSASPSNEPNVNVCPICMGFPGSRPLLNEEAVRIAKSIARALDCKIKDTTSFIRKVYFYPDLPKSFQISQLSDAIGSDGSIDIGTKKIGIRRIQIEEDPAKMIRRDAYTLIDFNRSGIPLVEIVTEPDISSENELNDTVFMLRSILYYQEIDVEQEIKTDLNISLGADRVEIKNVTGIRNLIYAAEYEIKRQNDLLSKGIQPQKETRSFDEPSRATKQSRKKESEEEYGFIYEPDLADFDISRFGVKKAVIPRSEALLLSERHGFNYKTTLQLIAFDSDALRLIKAAAGKYDQKTITSSVEELKRFRATNINLDGFEKLVKLSSDGIDLTEDMVKNAGKGEEISVKKRDTKEVDDAIRRILKNDKSLLERYKKNSNVVNFIIGEISRKYGMQPKDVAERLKLIIDESLDD